MKDREQEIQEADYDFPYHYLPELGERTFTQIKYMNWGYEYLSYLGFVVELVERLGVGSVLDVGCGDGRFLSELDRRHPGKRLVGIDYSQRAIGFARLLGAKSAEYVCGDVTAPGAISGRFEAVTMIETLEHIPPEACSNFLAGVRRFLEPGGHFVVTVPTTNTPTNPKHYRHFDLDSLSATLSPSFRVIEHHYVNRKSSFVKKFLEKLLTNRVIAMRSPKLGWFVYDYYCRHHFACGERDARRIVVRCEAAK